MAENSLIAAYNCNKMKQKLLYLLRSIRDFNQPKVCPDCGGQNHLTVDKKYVVTKLLRCESCLLQFRYPTDSTAFLENFYQADYKASYSEETHSITEFPNEEQLKQLLENNFPDKRNHSPFVYALLKKYSGKVLDYGASWGYSVYHLKQAGFSAEGFEISRPRAAFGKKLGVKIYASQADVPGDQDLIMSNHAIEHMPVISNFVKFATSKLKQDGIFMAFCPNGSMEYRKREPSIFHVNWGFLHPNYLDIEYASRLFSNNPHLILTGDWNYETKALAQWDGRSQHVTNKKDGKELLIIAKPNILLHEVY